VANLKPCIIQGASHVPKQQMKRIVLSVCPIHFLDGIGALNTLLNLILDISDKEISRVPVHYLP
jgi:hypothetical protein